jgi:periplasmic protein TonB
MGPTPRHSLRQEDDRDHVVVPLARAPVPDGLRQTETSNAAERTFDRRWIVVSIAAHLIVIGALVFGLLEAPQPPPTPVLQITLIPQAPGREGVSGGASGSTASVSADASATAAVPSTPDIPAPAPQPVSPPAPAQPEMPPPTPPQPEIPQPTPPAPEIPPPPPSPTKAVTPVPPRLAMNIPPPKPHYVPRRHPVRHEETPRRPTPPAPARQVAPVPPVAAAPPAETKTALAAPPGIGPGQGQGTQGAGKGAIGNSPGPGDDYLEKLYRHLLRYKKYPPEAIGAKQQGRVEVAFTIARDGTISGARIEKSSGSAMLDQATLALVQHASPAPPLPDSFKGSAARVKFPIDYKLSLIDQMF